MIRFLIASTFFLSCVSTHSFASSGPSDSSEAPIEKICSPTECYTITKELGEGVFGRVYAVEDSNGQPFAIKTYKNPLDPSHTYSYYTDAQREFSRGQFLNHPNIIRSYDFFMSDSNEEIANIVLDLVKGATVIKTPRGTVTNWSNPALQLVDALRYALSMGLMHLDLHGNNVMLGSDNNIKVIDLASFFTLEEIFGYLREELARTSEGKPSSVASSSSASASKSVYFDAIQESEKADAIPLVPIRAAKLKNFFDKNPGLLAKIQERTKETENSSLRQEEKLTKSASKNLLKRESIPETSLYPTEYASTDSAKIDLSPMQSDYFNRITEICIKLVLKSELSREEKIELRAKMKKIAWNYDEDVEDRIALPLSTYFEQLIEVLQEI